MSVTNATHQVQAVVDLLDAAGDSEWTPTPPTIRRYWDVTQSERGPGADQPPEVYVWSPTTTSLEQFSMDGTHFDQEDTIEVQVWSLDDAEARQLQGDVTDILAAYLDDNADLTPYLTVRPSGQNDFREQTSARKTDHYVMSVEIDLRKYDLQRIFTESAFDVPFDSPFA